MSGWEHASERYLAVWNGVASVDELDTIMTTDYCGHMGSRDRNLQQLKEDIVAYRARAADVRFEIVHRFGDGEYVASRVVAHARHPTTGAKLRACGLNVSRWNDDRLAEEWAVWEPLTDDS